MSDEVKKEPKKVAGKEAKDVEYPKDRLIYVGPNLGHGLLAQYTVFREGIPKHLEDLQGKYPLISDLFVPVSKLAYMQERISRPGTLEHQAYQSIVKGVE